jgi:hypothetical protein
VIKTTRKVAIFENINVERFLKSALTRDNEVRMYMLVAFGMHPENLRRLEIKKNISENGVLEFKRAKNDHPRRELLSSEISKVIYDATKRGVFKISNRGYEYICEDIGKRGIPDYESPPVSPLTLRHTFVLNCLREYRNSPDCLDVVASKAGCNKSTVIQNYIDMQDWEKIHEVEHQTPINLTNWVFMDK